MSASLDISDLRAMLGAMPPNARGRRPIEKLLVKLTAEELRTEQEFERALMDGIASDPETFADRISGALGGGA